MTELCKMFCPDELHDAQKAHREQVSRTENDQENDAEEEEEEEEKEEEEEEEEDEGEKMENVMGYSSMSDEDEERLREDVPVTAVKA